ncbi:MAG: hypothetical protein PHU53_06415, partial [Thermoplasmata archaeon]|nr:hypothetical protein [Thermoplasmata archaeon]
FYLEVLEIAREKKMLQEKFSCRTNLVLLGRLEYGDVIGDLTELNEKINSPETRIMFLDFKGTMALRKNDLAAAANAFGEAMELGIAAKGIGAEMLTAEIMLSMAKLEKARGNFGRALELARGAEDKFMFRGRLGDREQAREFILTLG